MLDLCAAPGSKTGQLLEMTAGGRGEGGAVVANDVDRERLQMMIARQKSLRSPRLLATNYPGQDFPSLCPQRLAGVCVGVCVGGGEREGDRECVFGSICVCVCECVWLTQHVGRWSHGTLRCRLVRCALQWRWHLAQVCGRGGWGRRGRGGGGGVELRTWD